VRLGRSRGAVVSKVRQCPSETHAPSAVDELQGHPYRVTGERFPGRMLLLIFQGGCCSSITSMRVMLIVGTGMP
jgi:hypothetical protein